MEIEILKCKCGLYLSCDQFKEVVIPGTWYYPQELEYVCPACGFDTEDMPELAEDEIVKLLNKK